MKKKYQKVAASIANEVVSEKILEISNQSEFKSLLLTARVGSVEYNIWKSEKNDEKFEVMKLVLPNVKSAEKDSCERMTFEEVQKIVVKALNANK